jgi:hypothetical protein
MRLFFVAEAIIIQAIRLPTKLGQMPDEFPFKWFTSTENFRIISL